jgi:hypothetical protein
VKPPLNSDAHRNIQIIIICLDLIELPDKRGSDLNREHCPANVGSSIYKISIIIELSSTDGSTSSTPKAITIIPASQRFQSRSPTTCAGVTVGRSAVSGSGQTVVLVSSLAAKSSIVIRSRILSGCG